MSTILSTITSAEEQGLEYLKSAQSVVLDAVKRGVEVAERYLPEERRELPFLAEAPKPADVIDTQFAFATKLLENQRDFAKAVLAAVNPVLPNELVVKKPVRKAATTTTTAAA